MDTDSGCGEHNVDHRHVAFQQVTECWAWPHLSPTTLRKLPDGFLPQTMSRMSAGNSADGAFPHPSVSQELADEAKVS